MRARSSWPLDRNSRKLDVPGEERLTGNGVSHCATCDAPLLRGRIVAVVGGGDSALQEGLTLAESASKVILLHRDDELTGQKCYRDRAVAHPKIEIHSNTIVTEILGETAVTGLRTRDMKSALSQRSRSPPYSPTWACSPIRASCRTCSASIRRDELLPMP